MTQENPEDWCWAPPPPQVVKKRKNIESDSEDEEQYAKYFKFSISVLQSLREDAEANGSCFSIQCTLSPICTKSPPFASVQAYEEHYSSFHMNVCATCRRILPTPRLLHLHLLEIHDSYFATLAQQQNAYECFVDGCSKKCKTPKTRIMHLQDKHKFPKRFDFTVIQGRFKPKEKSLSQPESTVNSLSEKTEFETEKTGPAPHENNDMDTTDLLVSSFSKLSIPRSVQMAQQRKSKSTLQ